MNPSKLCFRVRCFISREREKPLLLVSSGIEADAQASFARFGSFLGGPSPNCLLALLRASSKKKDSDDENVFCRSSFTMRICPREKKMGPLLSLPKILASLRRFDCCWRGRLSFFSSRRKHFGCFRKRDSTTSSFIAFQITWERIIVNENRKLAPSERDFSQVQHSTATSNQPSPSSSV